MTPTYRRASAGNARTAFARRHSSSHAAANWSGWSPKDVSSSQSRTPVRVSTRRKLPSEFPAALFS